MTAHGALTLACVLLGIVGLGAGCRILPGPPLPAALRVGVSGEDVLLELVDLENSTSLPLTICLDNVVIQQEAGGAVCGVKHFTGCIALAPRSTMSGAPVRGRAQCERLPVGRVRVLADLRFRRTSTRKHADVWQTMTLLTSAYVRRL